MINELHLSWVSSLNDNLTNLWKTIYPVGSIYMSTVSTSPATLFGGTWTQLKDIFLLGAGDTYSAGATGGAATVALTAANNGPHEHNAGKYDANWYASSAQAGVYAIYEYGNGNTRKTSSSGSGTPHNNMPPYLVVNMWRRTA